MLCIGKTAQQLLYKYSARQQQTVVIEKKAERKQEIIRASAEEMDEEKVETSPISSTHSRISARRNRKKVI